MDGLCECGCGQATWVSPCNDAPRGYVKGQSARFVRGHGTRGRLKATRWEERDCGYKTPCHVWLLAMAGVV